jgi:hypothetical protein
MRRFGYVLSEEVVFVVGDGAVGWEIDLLKSAAILTAIVARRLRSRSRSQDKFQPLSAHIELSSTCHHVRQEPQCHRPGPTIGRTAAPSVGVLQKVERIHVLRGP